MSSDGEKLVDDYLANCVEPQRSTLIEVRARLRDLLPDATEGLSYGFPTFKVKSKGVAGYAAYKHHCSYFPMSGSVFDELADDLTNYERTKGALHFAIDKPLPKSLLRKLVTTRLAHIAMK